MSNTQPTAGGQAMSIIGRGTEGSGRPAPAQGSTPRASAPDPGAAAGAVIDPSLCGSGTCQTGRMDSADVKKFFERVSVQWDEMRSSFYNADIIDTLADRAQITPHYYRGRRRDRHRVRGRRAGRASRRGDRGRQLPSQRPQGESTTVENLQAYGV